MTFQQIKNFISENYHDGNYQAAVQQYHHWQSNYNRAKRYQTQEQISDYQLGYGQAETDFQRDHAFHDYPQDLVLLANEIDGNQTKEVSDFVRGYKDGQDKFSK